MASLDRNLRRDLENAVKKARRVAEVAARAAIGSLGVGDADAPRGVDRTLRNRLRAHGRQLGDRLEEAKASQTIERLLAECAYEHWHRLLFARFLAENGLLVEPHSGQPLALDECRELARERGVDWLVLASEFAQRMLPQIFRAGDPVLELTVPAENRQELEDILARLPQAVFLADDSLGWAYQYWQDDEKDRINNAEMKIGGDELPAVTQLFTESYMVSYLIHNTLGAWWAGKRLQDCDFAQSADSEEAVRKWLAVPGVDWEYLRLSFDAKTGWMPAAGPFATWPRTVRELRVLDPSMGSGHFLVALLPVLATLRAEEEHIAIEDALIATLAENIFGLEIDPRCTQIASFALALTAWKRVGRPCPLPGLHVACCGLAPNSKQESWTALAKDDSRSSAGMAKLFELFSRAPVLGSLIDPTSVSSTLFQAGFDELADHLDEVLAIEERENDPASTEMAVVARRLLGATKLLLGKYHLVVTNVPYLVKGKQCDLLRAYCESYCPEGAADLATVFIERCRTLVCDGGTHATVSPQNWLYLKSYKAFRRKLLRDQCVNHVARVGSGATSTASWDVLRALAIVTRSSALIDQRTTGVEVSDPGEDARAVSLRSNEVLSALQSDIALSADSIFAFQSSERGGVLGSFASALQGISTGDSLRMVRSHWEIQELGERWRWFQVQPAATAPFLGRANVVDWVSLSGFEGAAIRGEGAWHRRGVAIAQMRALPATLYGGTLFSNSTPVIVPKREEHLSALWAFCCSPEFNDEVRRVNAKMSVDNGYLKHVRFDLAYWDQVARERGVEDELVPASSDPTQWLFDGSITRASTPLQVAVAQLLGFAWPSQRGEHPEGVAPSSEPRFSDIADSDGIVCLSPLNREASAVDRVQALLSAAFGSEWSATKLRALLDNEGARGISLEGYLSDVFFSAHCATFGDRPFIWQVWDGLKGGFSALLNYHKLSAPNGEGRRTLEKLIYTYLGEWIDRQRDEVAKGAEGADGRLAAAEHLKRELEKILEGESTYDIFVRWKPIHQQPLGWAPDINDGVRVNIRPFMTARPLNPRGRNACILRVPPKIKWDKDRGKEPARSKTDYPWFWGWDGQTPDFLGGSKFDGNRWNDLHYSRAAKQAARERAKGGKS